MVLTICAVGYFKKYFTARSKPNVITNVNIIAAPDGMSKKYEINSPEIVPSNANKVEKIKSFLKSFVYKFAVACGIVSNDKMRIIPTTRIFSTTVNAINIIIR